MNRRTVIASVGSTLGALGFSGTATAQDPALFEVTFIGTNSPVGPGETLGVDATITNVGGESGTTGVDFIVGYDPELVDSQTLSLAPNVRSPVVFEFRTGQPSNRHEQFPVRVDAGAHTVTEMVTVSRDGVELPDPALFDVANVWTNSPVGPFDVLEVNATIENVGTESGTTDVELEVGWDPRIEDSRLLTLGPGDSETVTLRFRAGDPSGGYESFPVRVDTGAFLVTEMVEVIG